MPGARCAAARRAEKNSHASVVTTVTPETPGIPRAMVYGFLRALPGDQDLLTPSSADNSTDLTPTSRRQDHTTSPSASQRLRQCATRVHRIPPPTSVTIAKRPSVWGGTAMEIQLIWVRWQAIFLKIRIFLQNGLDRQVTGESLIRRANQSPSFRGDGKHRTRNLEIPRCALAHLRCGANAPSRNDEEYIASSLPASLCGPRRPPKIFHFDRPAIFQVSSLDSYTATFRSWGWACDGGSL
jgi:hypothetical protein